MLWEKELRRAAILDRGEWFTEYVSEREAFLAGLIERLALCDLLH